MEFQELNKRAINLRKKYEVMEKQLYGSSWTNEEIALGFIGDVGDLAKLVIAENGKRNIDNSKDKLAHELSDCLWSIFVIADNHGIDLESSFIDTMNELEGHLSKTTT